MVINQGGTESIVAQQIDYQGGKVINLDGDEETEKQSPAEMSITHFDENEKVDQHQVQSSCNFIQRGEFHLKLGMIVYSVFDTTFRTNKYNMVCAPFVGINHNWQNVLLGCAFLLDETTACFTWVFEAFIEAMEKAPQTIFTDQDQAMANAIEKVFPGTCHRLCDWYIFKNVALKISHLYGKPEFWKKFSKCFLGCDTEVEFELTWKEMIEEWNASSNKWLNTLYSLKKKWCPAFSNDFFSANMKSTQMSESINNVFHRVSKKTMILN